MLFREIEQAKPYVHAKKIFPPANTARGKKGRGIYA